MSNQLIDINKHPLIKQAYEVCQAIEKCGASVELTDAVTKASALMQGIANAVSLLDELEAAQHEKDELQQGFIANQEEAHEAIKYATELKEQLARACAGREEAFREVDEMQKSLDHTHRRRAIWRGRAEEAEDKLEAAEARIAELEAREVKMPELKMLSDYLREVTLREREDIILGVKLEFHRNLKAAGISVKGE